MSAVQVDTKSTCELHTPTRNRYFYGKLLDASHFELETGYVNIKRWLLNRLVTGYGVVCGLDVSETPDKKSVIVTPGLAIDKHGREIIVAEETAPFPIPPPIPGAPCDDELERDYVHLVICYHECVAEPAPVLAGECCEQEACEPGVIHERYKLEFRPGCAPSAELQLYIPDVIENGKLDYATLARWVSRDCPPCRKDPCIPLANIRVTPEDDDECGCVSEIDISVRPLSLSNDLLGQLLLSLMISMPEIPGRK